MILIYIPPESIKLETGVQIIIHKVSCAICKSSKIHIIPNFTFWCFGLDEKNLHLSKPEVHASMQSKAVPILAYPITLITEVHCHCALLPVAVNTQAYQITFYEVLMTIKVP